VKIQKKIIYLYFIIILSIFLVSKIWGFIKLPYKDPFIVGIYSINEFNPINDILRYLIFLLLPVSIFLFFKVFLEKKSIKEIIFKFRNAPENIYKNNFIINYSFVLILLFLILEFLSLNFPLDKLDFVHEGQNLSSAYRSFLDNSLWSGSYVTIGIFYETLSSKFFWSFFDFQSIGLSRYAHIFYTLILKISFIILILKITKFVNLNIFYKNIFFIINSYISLSFLDYDIPSIDFITYREVPIIFISILFIEYLQNKNFKNYILISLAFISVVSMYWGVDRGLVCNLLIISILIFLILSKKYYEMSILFFFIIFFNLLSFLILGDEFTYFVSNTFSIYKEMSYIHGLIHPQPFSDDPNSYRATKTLISIVVIFIISLNLFFTDSKLFSIEFKAFLLFLSIISFFSYIYVVGRSDGPHMKHIFAYQLFFFSIYFTYLFLRALEGIKRLNFLLKLKKIIILCTLIATLLSLNLNIKNILNYSIRFNDYIRLPDQKFLDENDINSIKEFKPIVSKYECVQLFSNDVALLYLLKKQSCSKYYFIWSVGSHYNQKQLINDLKNTKLIISKGPSFDWDLPTSKKLPLVNNYINQNFYITQRIQDWEILKTK